MRQAWLIGMGLVSALASQSVVASEPSIEGTVTIRDRQGRPKPTHEGAVVFLDEIEHPAPATAPTVHAVMRQINKQFVPEVLPILVGTTVEFPNDDTIYHNVFSLSRVRPFDLGIYAQGVSQPVTFDQPGLVKIYCNIHSQMVGYILVLSHPYFAVTDRRGAFRLADAPLGKATIRVWYAKTRQQLQQSVQVTPQGIQNLDLTVMETVRFEIQEETLSLEHPNKFGESYPAKY